MKIAELGEFALLERIASWLPKEESGRLVVGIGDDAALWREDGLLQIATTDSLVEGVHFRWDTLSWWDLGWKALAVNLSDVAAMGGEPAYALVTLSLPPETAVRGVGDLYAGMGELARRWGVALAGGDLVRSPLVQVTVALLGRAGHGPDGAPAYLLRSAARPGDSLAVTGSLGAARGGLAVLSGERRPEGLASPLRSAHQRPQPRLREGSALLRLGVLAAMDLSDGLLADLEKIAQASGLAAQVEAAAVPVHPALAAAFPDRALSWALSGGEDYELLVAAPEPLLREAQGQGLSLHFIGHLVAGLPGQVTVLDATGQPMTIAERGWDHFKTHSERPDP